MVQNNKISNQYMGSQRVGTRSGIHFDDLNACKRDFCYAIYFFKYEHSLAELSQIAKFVGPT